MKSYPVIGKLRPDPVGKYIGSDFERFDTGTIAGLARVQDQKLEILAIVSRDPGKGHLRGFIRAAKEHYQQIHFLKMLSPQLDQALERYGFLEGVIVNGPDSIECRAWQKNFGQGSLGSEGPARDGNKTKER